MQIKKKQPLQEKKKFQSFQNFWAFHFQNFLLPLQFKNFWVFHIFFFEKLLKRFDRLFIFCRNERGNIFLSFLFFWMKSIFGLLMNLYIKRRVILGQWILSRFRISWRLALNDGLGFYRDFGFTRANIFKGLGFHED